MASSHIVSPPCGPIQGFQDGHVVKYRGIPFAKTPRFQPPQPLEPWTETFHATTPSAACPQPSRSALDRVSREPFLRGIPLDERTLQLSVVTPADVRPDEALCVMVWIFGGGFVVGAGDAALYDPSCLVAEHRLVVVLINYRLGLWGFLGDGRARPANLGLLDQIAALHWVRDNIAAFGGCSDPRSITIFGQSAGGTSVAALMLTNGAASLFGRVIIQSAPFGITYGRHRMNTALLGVVGDVSETSTTEEMLALMSKVNAAAAARWGDGKVMPFAPQYGHAPLPPEYEVDDLLRQVAPKFEILVGSTEHEASLTLDVFPWVFKMDAVPLVGRALQRWLVSHLSSRLHHIGERRFADKYAQFGGCVSLYRIGYAAPGNKYGATHCIELPLLFGSKEACYPSAVLDGLLWDQVAECGKKLRSRWADFARGRQLDASDSLDGIISIKRLN